MQDKVTPPATTPIPEEASVNYLPAEYYVPFLSDAAKRRKPNAIRGLFPLEKVPGVISLLAGKPNPTTFPLTNLEVTIREPPAEGGSNQEPVERRLAIPSEHLAAGLQYGGTGGFEPFVEWLEGLQKVAHGRLKTDAWSLCVGSGAQDLLYKVRTYTS